MEQQLIITTAVGKDRHGHQLRSSTINVLAETTVSSDDDFPESFTGKLLKVGSIQLNRIRFGPDVEVNFLGKRYKFIRLEQDGNFELQKGLVITALCSRCFGSSRTREPRDSLRVFQIFQSQASHPAVLINGARKRILFSDV